jgi:hypothetical protein
MIKKQGADDHLGGGTPYAWSKAMNLSTRSDGNRVAPTKASPRPIRLPRSTNGRSRTIAAAMQTFEAWDIIHVPSPYLDGTPSDAAPRSPMDRLTAGSESLLWQ